MANNPFPQVEIDIIFSMPLSMKDAIKNRTISTYLIYLRYI